jgi:hypothetical protein
MVAVAVVLKKAQLLEVLVVQAVVVMVGQLMQQHQVQQTVVAVVAQLVKLTNRVMADQASSSFHTLVAKYLQAVL